LGVKHFLVKLLDATDIMTLDVDMIELNHLKRFLHEYLLFEVNKLIIPLNKSSEGFFESEPLYAFSPRGPIALSGSRCSDWHWFEVRIEHKTVKRDIGSWPLPGIP
jgi:hypothetical protein